MFGLDQGYPYPFVWKISFGALLAHRTIGTHVPSILLPHPTPPHPTPPHPTYHPHTSQNCHPNFFSQVSMLEGRR